MSPDSDIVSYEWNFGNNAAFEPDTASGVEAEHTFAKRFFSDPHTEPASYTVTLTVTDAAGRRASTTHEVFWLGEPTPVPELAAHPRFYLDDEVQARLDAKQALNSVDWQRFMEETESSITRVGNYFDYNTRAMGLALAYRQTGETRYAERAIALINGQAGHESFFNYDVLGNPAWVLGDTFVVLDWLHDYLVESGEWAAYRDKTAELVKDAAQLNLRNIDTDHVLKTARLILMGSLLIADEVPEMANYWAFGYDALWYGRWHGLVRQYPNTFYPLEGAQSVGGVFDLMIEDLGEDGVWMEGSVYNTVTLNDLMQTYRAVLTATGLDLLGDHKAYLADVATGLIHQTLPDGFNFYTSDDQEDLTDDNQRITPSETGELHERYENVMWSVVGALGADAPESGYAKYWINQTQAARPAEFPSIHYVNELLRVLWNDEAIPAVDYRQEGELPTDFYANGVKFLFDRSDWTEDATMLVYEGSSGSVDHMHQDALSFNILRKGQWLTKDYSGYFSGGSGPVETARAHNTLLIENRREDGTQAFGLNGHQADSEVVNSHTGDGYSYIVGDATGVYNDAPDGYLPRQDVQKAMRNLVYLKPDLFVVYDDTQTRAEAGEQFKRFILHSHNQPTVTGDVMTSVIEDQRLYSRTLLPADAQFTVSSRIAVSTQSTVITDAWHTQVESAVHDSRETFLHVIEGTDASQGQMSTTDRVTSLNGNMVGAYIEKGFNYVVLFGEDSRGFVSETSYQVAYAGAARHLLFNMVPEGVYQVDVAGNSYTVQANAAGIVELALDTDGLVELSLISGEVPVTGLPEIDEDFEVPAPVPPVSENQPVEPPVENDPAPAVPPVAEAPEEPVFAEPPVENVPEPVVPPIAEAPEEPVTGPVPPVVQAPDDATTLTPVINLQRVSAERLLPVTYRFDASQSVSPDSDIVSYEWNFGTGSSAFEPDNASGAVAEHTYVRQIYSDPRGGPASYTVTLTVTDAAGRSATATEEVFWVGEPTQITELAAHPRFYLTDEVQSRLDTKQALNSTDWQLFIEEVESSMTRSGHFYDFSARAMGLALAYRQTGEERYAERAMALLTGQAARFPSFLDFRIRGTEQVWILGDVVIALDWLYDYLVETGQWATFRDKTVELVKEAADINPRLIDTDYRMKLARFVLLGSTLVYDEVPEVANHFAYAYDAVWFGQWHGLVIDYPNRFYPLEGPQSVGGIHRHMITGLGEGGVWMEGSAYNSISLYDVMQTYTALHTATGLELFDAATYMPQVAQGLMHHTLPDGFNLYPSEDQDDMTRDNQRITADETAQLLEGYENAMWAIVGNLGTEDRTAAHAKYWIEQTKAQRHQHSRDGSSHATLQVLWNDEALAAVDYRQANELPTDFYANGMQYFFDRSDWSEDATLLAYEGSGGYVDHMHQDALSFNIMRGGQWITKENSGLVHGGSSAFADARNQNTLLIENNLEDGDQRFGVIRPQAESEVVNRHVGEGYSYIAGDATGLYNDADYVYAPQADTLKAMRSLVYLKPDLFVVYDDTQTRAEAGERFKRFILHTHNQPQVSGDVMTAVIEDQRIFSRTLLPADADIEVMNNLVTDPNIINVFGDIWHIEVESAFNDSRETFLHVIEGADASQGQMATTEQVTSLSGNMVGTYIEKDGNHVVLFAEDSRDAVTEASYQVSHTGDARHLLFNMVPEAVYQVTLNAVSYTVQANAAGVLDLTLESDGFVELIQVSDDTVVTGVPAAVVGF